MFINKIVYLVLLIFLFCSCGADTDKTLSDSFKEDEEQFSVDTIDATTKCLLDSIWNKPYESNEYEAYIETLNLLLKKGYLHSADKFSSKVITKNISPEQLTGYYNVLGTICMYSDKPDSAIYYFGYVYIRHPIAPHYIGHNQLHFYNYAVMSMIEAGRCHDARLYFDSLKTVVSRFPDSLFYIGGEQRIQDFEKNIHLICTKQN